MNTKLITALTTIALLCGCGSNARTAERKPEFSPGEGAISGKLVGKDSEPFDLALTPNAKSLQIELISPVNGIAAATYPQQEKSTFVFSHLKPGRYEVSTFTVVTGKRTIAGSTPVTVNAEQVTPVTVTLTVTPIQQ